MLDQQLLLPLTPNEEPANSPPSDEEFEHQLAELSSGRIVAVKLTRNRSTILSAKPLQPDRLAAIAGAPKQVAVRIHRCFVDAPRPVLDAAVDFASKRLTKVKRREALDVLREYFDQHAPQTKPAKRRPPVLRGPKGQHHDLGRMFDSLNAEYFDGALALTVTWGNPPRRRSRRRRTIQLGSYHDESQTIRLHPVLDQKEVPSFVVESVLHHEMVHAVVPVTRRPGTHRRRIHTPEFRRREREFKHLQRAERWLEHHLFRLMGRMERALTRAR